MSIPLSAEGNPQLADLWAAQVAQKKVRNQFKKFFYERNREIDLLMAALIAQRDLLFLGEPGIAKTDLVTAFAKALGLRFWELLATADSVSHDLWGPTDLRALREENKRRHAATEDYAQNTEVVFLDETFRGTSGFLNSLLKLMAQRLWEDEGKSKPLPLMLLVGAANALKGPEDNVGALKDRFLFWHTSVRLSRTGLRGLLRSTLDHKRPFPTASVGLEQVTRLQQAVPTVLVKDAVFEGFFSILDAMQDEGLPLVSDRRLKWTLDALRAQALIKGRLEATMSDLSIVQYCLFTDPAQEAKVASLVMKIASPSLEAARATFDNATLVAQEVFAEIKGMSNGQSRTSHILAACQKLTELIEKNLAEHERASGRGQGEDADQIAEYIEQMVATRSQLSDMTTGFRQVPVLARSQKSDDDDE